MRFSVISFNVRGSYHDDGVNAWDRRRDLNVATIRQYSADVLAFQEAQSGNLGTYGTALTGYDVEPGVLMLHTMLTARVNPFGIGSNISRAYERCDITKIDPVLAARVRQYHTPYILDGWTPHFTLLMPYKGLQREAMYLTLCDLFPADTISATSVCLLVRQDGESHYRLHREFSVGKHLDIAQT